MDLLALIPSLDLVPDLLASVAGFLGGRGAGALWGRLTDEP